MEIESVISKNLISSRNILLNKCFNKNILTSLEEILNELNLIPIKEVRNIVKFCVEESLIQVKDLEYISAGLILNFIHNLPFNKSKYWDVDYFLTVELTTFLEKFDEIKNSRKIALYVFDKIQAIEIAANREL